MCSKMARIFHAQSVPPLTPFYMMVDTLSGENDKEANWGLGVALSDY
jgi:hypothetical protein